MTIKEFKASSVKECLKLACKELEIPEEKINYTVLEEKRGLFRKSAIISVEIKDVEENIEVEESKAEEVKNKKGTVRILDGNVIVKNPDEGQDPALIHVDNGIKLFVNDNLIKESIEVFEDSDIRLEFENSSAERKMNISLSPDRMEAYISIEYVPEKIYSVASCDEGNFVTLQKILKEEKYPPKFSVEEIKEALRNNKVIHGILDVVLEQCSKIEIVENELIAKGDTPIDDTDDEIEIIYKETTNELVEDNSGRIDFKSSSYIAMVEEGDTLAIKKVGTDGKDGMDVTGNSIKHKISKRISLVAGEGCQIVDENTVVATMKGKPFCKGSKFEVLKVHEVQGDVDVKVGNISFNGSVFIYGNVKEGMKIEAHKSINIHKNVAHSEVVGGGDINILGNVIYSKIVGGRDDAFNLNFIKILKEFNEVISNLKESSNQVKEHNLLGRKARDGEILKILIENKFKRLPKLIEQILSANIEKNEMEDNLGYCIRKMLVGLAPLSIESIDKLDILISLTEDKLKRLKEELTVPVDIFITYCQDSTINSSGNVNITGKGEYVSDITAHDGVYFTGIKSVARGGTIKAKNEIRCKHVGSLGGVSTQLIVDKTGHIWAEVAYQNTKFIVGNREYILETPAKDVHAYIDDSGELIVDKFKI